MHVDQVLAEALEVHPAPGSGSAARIKTRVGAAASTEATSAPIEQGHLAERDARPFGMEDVLAPRTRGLSHLDRAFRAPRVT